MNAIEARKISTEAKVDMEEIYKVIERNAKKGLTWAYFNVLSEFQLKILRAKGFTVGVDSLIKW